ncbi:metabotropic glutamate receptor 8-like [Brevipalpus obovatus]|uniref:metabotropic glutamate receptor 8-like n=1 Tax=Brevipalpus obovatus TaxID=246614 RepID=UPI003D9E342D
MLHEKCKGFRKIFTSSSSSSIILVIVFISNCVEKNILNIVQCNTVVQEKKWPQTDPWTFLGSNITINIPNVSPPKLSDDPESSSVLAHYTGQKELSSSSWKRRNSNSQQHSYGHDYDHHNHHIIDADQPHGLEHQNADPLRGGHGFSYPSSMDKVRPAKKVGLLDGNITLGGLMMVHERGETEICGQIMPQGGIHALECMLYTIDWVNRNKNILPGITLGAYILDDCDRDTYGLEQAVDFIKGSIGDISDGAYQCRDGSAPVVEQKVISGVLGAASSVTSIQVANLLRLFGIPQISFFSTSPELSNKDRFKYFLRTVPSDDIQTLAMVEIIKRMNWTYVSVLYEESNYGVKAFEALENWLMGTNICIAVKEKLPKDSGVADSSKYDTIVGKLRDKHQARGVIVFGSDQEVKALMQAVKRGNLTGKYQWIGSDGWSARALVSDGNEEQVEGTLSIQPMSKPVEGFDEYFTRLDPKRNETLRRNPWFIEFWEHFFKCKWNGSQVTPYNQQYSKFCTGIENMIENGYEAERQLQFVSDAVLAFAFALHEMHRDKCNGIPGICSQMKSNDGNELLKYLKNVTFTGLSGDEFRFSANQDGPVRYDILHFKYVHGAYKWIEVGTYIDGELNLRMDDIQFTHQSPSIPLSICSFPCDKGEAMIGDKCCWRCTPCSKYQIVSNYTRCTPCPDGELPDELTQTLCVPVVEEYVDINDPMVIGALTFSTLGIITVTWIAIVFLRFQQTPVVRAASRELIFLLLFGILTSYSITYLLILRPSRIVCGFTHTMIGCSFSIVYSSILIKTNRIARIFESSKKSAARPQFISPQSQLAICFMLILVQMIITLMWFAFYPPMAIHFYPIPEKNVLKCSTTNGVDFFLAFAYPFILIFVCTVYAVLTRKIPEAFNESKHIGFTMYTTCVIWIAFIPIYITTRNDVTLNIITLSYSINSSSTIAILCLFSAKLYIILLHPEKNIRQSMINTTKYGGSIGLHVSDKSKQNNLPHNNSNQSSRALCSMKIESDESETSRAQSEKAKNLEHVDRSSQTSPIISTKDVCKTITQSDTIPDG